MAISGPRQGEIFPISEEESMIGRDSDWLLLSDPSASRRHCAIKPDEEGFKLQDLESRNGTFVNGVPIKEKLLQHGDRIEIGNSLFLFLSHEPINDPSPIETEVNDGGLLMRSTIRARIEDVLYLQPEKLDAFALPGGRIARGLQTLLRISTTIGSIRNLEALQNQLLESVFEFVPAQRGAVLLANRDRLEFLSILGRHRDSAITEPVQVDRSIALQALQESAAIMSNDIQNEPSPSSKNVGTARVTSILCAPLVVLRQIIGVLYLDTSDPGVRFDEDHLQLVTAVAGIAAGPIENCRHMEDLQIENQQLKSDLRIEHDFIGESKAMRNVYDFVARAAPSDSTILICGETGTGKELAARAIHHNSPRSNKPFVALNCATLSETLLESELFGHEKGAFTGAIAQKRGKLEMADGGTVFLDEVVELAPSLQAKLLRVLQEREFERVGGTRPIRVDIRLIAATNKNLEQAIQNGVFRKDLYYRLNVLPVTMPALRERVEDIPLLATHFAAKYSRKTNRKIVGISSQARRYLVCYRWPGNVRELENAIERAVVLGTENLILPEDLPEVIVESQPVDVPLSRYQEAVKEAKRQLVLRTMEQANGNYVEAAKLLEVHPNNLHRLIRDLDLKSVLK